MRQRLGLRGVGVIYLVACGATKVDSSDRWTVDDFSAGPEADADTDADIDADSDADSDTGLRPVGLIGAFEPVWLGTISPYCVRCHRGSDPTGELNLLTQEVAYTNLICSVVPGNPDISQLYSRIIRTGEGRMPPGEMIPPDQIEEVRTWISEGAYW